MKMKYGKAIQDKICSLIASDDYTIPELCKQAGIVESTYHQWKIDHSDFSEAIKKAHEKRLEVFKQAARSGLLTLLQGTEYDEVTSEYENTKPDERGKSKKILKARKVVRKFILPNPTSVIFALKNLDDANFNDVMKVDQTTKIIVTRK